MSAFLPGKLITSVVTGIAHRRPQGESYDQAIRNDATGLWQCPFCQQDNFPELSEVTDTTAVFLLFAKQPDELTKHLILVSYVLRSHLRCGITLTAVRVQVRLLGCGPD